MERAAASLLFQANSLVYLLFFVEVLGLKVGLLLWLLLCSEMFSSIVGPIFEIVEVRNVT